MESGQISFDGNLKEYLIERKKTSTIKYKVYPDLTIKVIVPESMPFNDIQFRVNNRKTWIRQQIEFYNKNKIDVVSQYKSGTTIKYLGKQYRLKIIQNEMNSIKLVGRFLEVRIKKIDARLIETMIDEWYRTHAAIYFNRMVEKSLKKVAKYGISSPILSVRKMKSRWGSCIQNKNRIILNLNLIKEKSQFIEYVIMHELCHLKYANHNKQFYTFISIVMPDWQFKKQKLAGLNFKFL